MAVASANLSNWVNELDAFESTTLPALSARSSTKSLGNMSARSTSRIPTRSQAEELRQEMKLLQWHKLANEAALKAALIKTKKLKREDTLLLRKVDADERAEWMQQIIEEEQSKPMEVTVDFIQKYQEQEKREEDRKESEVQRHIASLQHLKKTLKEREEMRQRQMRYRVGVAALAKKNINQSEDQENERRQKQSEPVKSRDGTLNSVIHSLDKLVGLEKRITDLENDNYEAPQSALAPVLKGVTTAGASTKGRSRIHFTKKRSDTAPNVPAKTVYAVKVTRTVGKRQLTTSKVNKVQSSTFMTSVPEKRVRVTRNRVTARRMTDRQRRTVERMDKKKQVAKESNRQDAVINDWLKKKKTRTPVIAKRKPRVSIAARGAASGRTTGNRHMQQFNDMKRNIEKRKETLNRPTRSIISSKPSRARMSASIRNRSNGQPAWGGGSKVKRASRTLPTVPQMTRRSIPTTTGRRTTSKPSTTLPKLEKGTAGSISMGITGRTLR